MITSSDISGVVGRQFAKVWTALRALVEACPQEQWLAGPAANLVPVRQAYHVAGGAEWCCEEDRFAVTNPFGLQLCVELFREDLPATGWPDRAGMLKLIDDVERRIVSNITGMNDAQWLAPARSPMVFGNTPLEQFLYMLRHCQEHIGELKAEFRRRGLPVPDWA